MVFAYKTEVVMPQGRSLAISCNYDFLIKSLVYDRNHYWPILSADTVTDTKTDTETTFQRENLMGYFSHYKRAPKTKLAAKYQRF